MAVDWAVFFFLFTGLARGLSSYGCSLPVWLILAYALLPRTHRILTLEIAMNCAVGPSAVHGSGRPVRVFRG